jgi:hypothetical protein
MHRRKHPVQEHVVVQSLVDATEPRIHLLLRLEIAEPENVPEPALPVAASNHPDL